MNHFIKSSMVILLMISLSAGLIFLPEYIAGRTDAQYMGQYNLYDREVSNGILSGLSLEEKIKMLSMGENRYEKQVILSINSLTELAECDKTLMKKLNDHVLELEVQDLMPKISSNKGWKQLFEYGELYNLIVPDNPGVVFPVWELTFFGYDDRIGDYFMYSFMMDANTYQIYRMFIYDYSVFDYSNKMYYRYTNKDDSGAAARSREWLDKYGSYLADTEARVYNVLDIDVFIAAGSLQMGETKFGIRCAVSYVDDIYGKGYRYDIFGEEEYQYEYCFYFSICPVNEIEDGTDIPNSSSTTN